jgi:hypothetical protein
MYIITSFSSIPGVKVVYGMERAVRGGRRKGASACEGHVAWWSGSHERGGFLSYSSIFYIKCHANIHNAASA